MKHFKFENIKKGPWTTAIGVLLILAGLADKFYLLSSWTEAMVAIVPGAFLLFKSDPTIKGGGTAACLLVILMLFTGCTTYQKCADKYGEPDTTLITVRDTVFKNLRVKPPVISYNNSFRLDSLLWAEPGIATSYYNADSTQKVTLKKDANNDRLSISTECDPDTIKVSVPIPVEVEAPCPQTKFVPKPETLPEKAAHTYKNIAAYGFPLFLTLFIILLRKR